MICVAQVRLANLLQGLEAFVELKVIQPGSCKVIQPGSCNERDHLTVEIFRFDSAHIKSLPQPIFPAKNPSFLFSAFLPGFWQLERHYQTSSDGRDRWPAEDYHDGGPFLDRPFFVDPRSTLGSTRRWFYFLSTDMPPGLVAASGAFLTRPLTIPCH